MEHTQLRIGLLLSSLGTVRGGLETIATHLAHGLARRGHKVTVVSGRWPRHTPIPEVARLRVQHMTVPCLPMNAPAWRWIRRSRPGLPLKAQSLSFYYACRCYPVLHRHMRRWDITLSFLEIETAKLSVWRQQYSKPHVSYFPGCIDEGWLGQDRSAARVAISQTIATQAKQTLGLPIHSVAPPGIDDEWLEETYQVRTLASKLVFVGRLEANKGVQELLSILGMLAQNDPNIQLCLVGSGPLEPWIDTARTRLGLGAHLTWHGALSASGVKRELQSADLFIFPSRYESWGMAVMEAMAVGLPVVCSDLPALREATQGAACLLPAGDIPAWVTTIRALLKDTAERQKLSVAGRARAREVTWSRTTQEMERVFYRVLQEDDRV